MATQLMNSLSVEPAKIYSSSSVQEVNLGTMAHSQDGRRFRYVKAGVTALVPGKLQQASAEDTTNFQNLTVTAPTAGDTSITTTSTTTLTVNQLAGGLVTISAGTLGVGQVFRIKSHPAVTAAVVTVQLEDPVVTTCTGTVKIDMIPSPYSAVIVNPATASSAPIGVAVYPVAASEFGWVQVGGPCPVLADGTVTVGTAVDASNGTAGAVEAHPEAGVQAPVGIAITGVATTEYGFINLMLN